jgi:superfamily II DNA or RNA helicase
MRVELKDVDVDSLEDIVGTECYEEALWYVRQQVVVQQVWVPAQNALCGVVRGKSGEFYTPAVYFSSTMQISSAQCSCAARYGCEHAAALLMAATETAVRGMPDVTAAPGRPPAAKATATPAWQQSLDSLLTPGTKTATSSYTPLAIELSLASAQPTPGQRSPGQRTPGQHGSTRLMARLVQPGRNGNWVYGTLSWGKLDSYEFHGGYEPLHLRLLRELHALQRSQASHSYYYYAHNDERLIELSAGDSARLWPLLDEADAAGLRMVHAGSRRPVERHGEAEFCLDVTTDTDGALRIAPVIRVDGAGKKVLTFIGMRAHGVVCQDEDEAEFKLIRLKRAVPVQLQDQVLSGQHLTVPAAEQASFRDRYCPRLRHTATLVSSDGSFTPPEISEPTLVMRADYGDKHDVEVAWEWLYQVGDSQVRTPLAPQHDGDYRNLEAERAILDSLPPSISTRDGQQLHGFDTMRFTTEMMPFLHSQPSISVEVSGVPADYREATPSIGVATDERKGDTDWFDLSVTVMVEDRPVPFTDVFTALSRGDSHLLLADGAYFSLEKPELQALARLIDEARALQDHNGPLSLSRFQASLWDELTALGVVSRQAQAWQQQVEGLLNVAGLSTQEPPATLNAQLRPYQLDGFRWLAFLWRHQLGGILADDMGLGKTLQTLALISHAKQTAPGSPPFLIVAPTSVVPNWAAEAAKFTPDLTVATVTTRGQRLSTLNSGADAIVVSYTLLRLDFEDYADQEWSGLFLDEAQSVKNHQSQIYQCARKLPAPFKVAITGTPVENNLMELWSLLSIAAPGLFPHPDKFKEYYAYPIERKASTELLAQLKRRIRPLLLRRTKEQVARDLPAKQEQVLEIELHPKHRKLYQTHLQRERQKVLGLIGDMNANRFTILRSLTLLRQLSLHPALIDTVHGDIPCAKIDSLVEQIRDVMGGGHRALVFSQFTGFLMHVRLRLAAAGISYCYLDGSTRDRTGVISSFKDGTAPVFLISLKAGGFGLNLTEADYCFLLDPWWNPATETQAIDRTHRIGQTRNVMVYRLIAKDTIEEKVMALKARKAELSASVLDDGTTFGTTLTPEDIKGLFS